MCDETSDSLNRSVFQIIFIKLYLNVDNKPKLVDTVFLDEVNFETVSRALVDCLVKMEVLKCNGFYFRQHILYDKSFQVLPQNFIIQLYSRHMFCSFHLVGETWRSNLNEIDGIVANLKSIFPRVENPKLYPSPVVTRWNTLFNAILIDEDDPCVILRGGLGCSKRMTFYENYPELDIEDFLLKELRKMLLTHTALDSFNTALE
ncbi:unnamed protein product [Brachionus calyciflorus]|uniref:Uncharacterized protein n=1 Tax=Brachionus calyciflorus TaxID=104777 RepID=A0A814I2A6_9BILA|nr:unnamed protein product [Brachionus calyciflorus]